MRPNSFNLIYLWVGRSGVSPLMAMSIVVGNRLPAFNSPNFVLVIVIDSKIDIEKWIKLFDKIYISFDVDCIDPSIFKSVNTPVDNGLSIEKIKDLFSIIKKSNKLMAMDIVEYNPTIEKNEEPIIEILKYIFEKL